MLEVSYNRQKQRNISFMLRRLQIISKKLPGKTKVVNLIY